MNDRPNPWVGPRPFAAADVLPGRDREVQDLRMVLISARVLILHSPSGAGKSSLLEARNGLRAELVDRGFHVWPTLRVGTPLPADAPPGANRYEVSAMRGLPGADRIPTARLVDLGLDGLLRQLREQQPADEAADGPTRARELLILDQFEEVLTADAADDAGRAQFFDRLATVLKDAWRFAIIVLREDYLGALEPWARRLPTHLAHRFRIDLLAVDKAEESIRAPATAAGVHVDDDALAWLITELRMVSVMRLDGSLDRVPGPWLEPVQLQVVCHRLWPRLSSDARRISLDDVVRLGNVDESLGRFYAECVAEVASASQMSERALRTWFGRRLISPQGIRMQVIRGEGDGLAPDVIDRLETAHLLRGDLRRGVKWYELSHDRLVGPVRADNERWEAEVLQPFQRKAAAWVRKGRPDALLLDDEALAVAEAWADAHPAAVDPDDREFLDQSHDRVEDMRRDWGRAAGERTKFFVASTVVGLGLWVATTGGRSSSLTGRELAVIAGVFFVATALLAGWYRRGMLVSEVTRQFTLIYLATIASIAMMAALERTPAHPNAYLLAVNSVMCAAVAATGGVTFVGWLWLLVPVFLASAAFAQLRPDDSQYGFAAACVSSLVIGVWRSDLKGRKARGGT